MSAERWIIVPNWERFQHYRDREPTWIKLYLELRNRDDWRSLTLAERGLLVSLWIEYAPSRGLLSTRSLPSRVAQKNLRRALDSLVAAGFIELSASKPLALARARVEREEEREPPSNSPRKTGGGMKRIRLHAYTGCRATRGAGGVGWIRDPLGRDRPPSDWPFPPPTREEVRAALTRNGSAEQPGRAFTEAERLDA
jgi:hypothetical protein